MIVVKSFDGTSLDSATYSAGLPGEGNAFGGSVAPVVLDVVGGYQRYEGADVLGKEFTLEVSVLDLTKARIQGLSEVFRKGLEGPLVIEWDGVEMVRDCAVLDVLPMTPSVNVFVVVLFAADPRWRTLETATETESLTATGQGMTVNNPGNAAEDRAVIRLTPTLNKAASAAELFRRYAIIVNRSKRALLDWPIDITNYDSTGGPSGGLDHAALTTTKSQADAKDVRVLVDGREVPRFLGEHANTDADSARMSIWISIPWSAAQTAHLRANITNVSPANGEELEVLTDEVRTWPKSGYLVTNDGEVIGYSGWTRSNDDGYSAFTGIRRGCWGTTAAASSADEILYRAEHKIEVIYGQTSNLVAPDTRLDVKPMLNLASNTLSNKRHEWIDFYSDLYPLRPGQWVRRSEPRDTQFDFMFLPTAPTGVAASLAFAYHWEGQPIAKDQYNVVRRSIPVGTDGTDDQFAFTHTVEDTLAIEALGVSQDGREYRIDRIPGPTSAAAFASDPLEKYYELAIYARSRVLVSIPLVAGVDINVDGLFVTINLSNATGDQTQPIINSLDVPVLIEDIYVAVSQNAPQQDLIFVLYPDDGSGAPNTGVIIAAGIIDSTDLSNVEAWRPIDFVTTALSSVWLPDTTMYLFAQMSAGTHGASVWMGWAAVYAGESPMRSFRVCGDGPIDPNARAEEGDLATVDGIAIDLDPNGIPSFALMAESDLYELNGTLVNETTEQELRFKIYATTNDTIEVDVGNRTVRNLDTGEEGLLYGIFPNDEAAWFSLAPGDNVLRYDETGLAGLDLEVEYYGRWE